MLSFKVYFLAEEKQEVPVSSRGFITRKVLVEKGSGPLVPNNSQSVHLGITQI
jgi:hypothetical protein